MNSSITLAGMEEAPGGRELGKAAPADHRGEQSQWLGFG